MHRGKDRDQPGARSTEVPAYPNFLELRQREVRRINLPRTPVNKGQGYYTLAPFIGWEVLVTSCRSATWPSAPSKRPAPGHP